MTLLIRRHIVTLQNNDVMYARELQRLVCCVVPFLKMSEILM